MSAVATREKNLFGLSWASSRKTGSWEHTWRQYVLGRHILTLTDPILLPNKWGGSMHLFLLVLCKIYAQLLPGTKNVRRSKGFKIIRRKVIWEYQPARFSISSSGARSRVRDIYLWKAICALESLLMFKRVSTKKVPSPPRGRRGLRLTKCREVGGEGGGLKQPLFWAVTLFNCEPL